MDFPPLKKKTSKNDLLRDEDFLDRKITGDIPTTKFVVLFNAFYVIWSFPDSNVLNMKTSKYTRILQFRPILYILLYILLCVAYFYHSADELS